MEDIQERAKASRETVETACFRKNEGVKNYGEWKYFLKKRL